MSQTNCDTTNKRSVFLVTDDGHELECDINRLKENSLYFNEILEKITLKRESDTHKIIILMPDCKFHELEYITKYIQGDFPTEFDEESIESLCNLVDRFKFNGLKEILLEHKRKKFDEALSRLKHDVKLAFIDAGVQFKQFKTKFSPTSVMEKAIKCHGLYYDTQIFGDLQCETRIRILGRDFVSRGVTMTVARKSAAILALKDLFGIDYTEEARKILMSASCNMIYVPEIHNGSSDDTPQMSAPQIANDYIEAQIKLRNLSGISPLATLQAISERKIETKFTVINKKFICTLPYHCKTFTGTGSSKIEASNKAARDALQEFHQIIFNYSHPITFSISMKLNDDWKLWIQKLNPTQIDSSVFSLPLIERLRQAMEKFSSTPISRLKSRFVTPTLDSNEIPLLTENEWKLLEEIDSNAVPCLNSNSESNSEYNFHITINGKKIEGTGSSVVMAKDDLIRKSFEYLQEIDLKLSQGVKRKTEDNVSEAQSPLKMSKMCQNSIQTLSWQDKLRKLNDECRKEGKSVRDLPPIQVLNNIGMNIGLKLNGDPKNPNVNKIKKYAEDTLKKLLEVMKL